MKNLKWVARYSDTEQPDKKGRWARLLYFDKMLIVWVNRVGNGETVKYQANTFFPVHEMADCPSDNSLHNSFDEAKHWAEKMWDDFVTKVTRISFIEPAPRDCKIKCNLCGQIPNLYYVTNSGNYCEKCYPKEMFGLIGQPLIS